MKGARTLVLAVACLASLSAAAENEVNDKYHVTAGEKAACTKDAVRLCMWAYPDEDKLVGCMRENVTQLSKTCKVAFEAGMRRRGL